MCKLMTLVLAAFLAIPAHADSELLLVGCASLKGAASKISLTAKQTDDQSYPVVNVSIGAKTAHIDLEEESNDFNSDIIIIPSKSYYEVSFHLTSDAGNDVHGDLTADLKTMKLASRSNDVEGAADFVGHFTGEIARAGQDVATVQKQDVLCRAEWKKTRQELIAEGLVKP